jgi:hypothetical protein
MDQNSHSSPFKSMTSIIFCTQGKKPKLFPLSYELKNSKPKDSYSIIPQHKGIFQNLCALDL